MKDKDREVIKRTIKKLKSAAWDIQSKLDGETARTAKSIGQIFNAVETLESELNFRKNDK